MVMQIRTPGQRCLKRFNNLGKCLGVAQRKESLVRGRRQRLWLTVAAVVVDDAVALALASLSHGYRLQRAGPLGFIMEHQKRKAPPLSLCLVS